MDYWYKKQSFITKIAHFLGGHYYYHILRNHENAKICLCGRYKDEEEYNK